MLQDLDREMERSGLEAVAVVGEDTSSNPEFYYVTRADILRGGIYLKKVNEEPTLVVSSIDVRNARRGAVRDVASSTDYGYEEIARRLPAARAKAQFYERLLREKGVTGRIAFYGHNEFNSLFSLVLELRKSGFKVAAEKTPHLFERIMATKSDAEIFEIEMVGRQVQKIFSDTAALLKRCKMRGKTLLHGGKRLTVGTVKSHIRTLFAENDLTPAEGFIVAAGTRSSDPHYGGEANDPIKTNQPIVIDLFPKGGNNMYFDFTRTVLVGRAGKELRRMHEAVAEAHDEAIDAASEHVKANELMYMACELLEAHGYKTVKSLVEGKIRKLEDGFTHSLGHGVGWTLGEKPSLTLFSKDEIRRGHVFTVEPGLYDRKVGGIRIEDVVAVTSKGVKKLSTLGYAL